MKNCCFSNDGWDISSWLSIIAIIVSILAVILTYRQSRKEQIHSIEGEYFLSLFKEFLIDKIPNAREKLHYDQLGRLIDPGNLCTILNTFRQEARYYMYADEQYYKKIAAILQEIEDTVLNGANCKFSIDEQPKYLKKINKSIHKLYKCTSKRYS